MYGAKNKHLTATILASKYIHTSGVSYWDDSLMKAARACRNI